MNLFESAKDKNISTNKPKSVRTRGRRTEKKWENQFKISQKIFESLAELGSLEDEDLIRDACVGFRNPVVFDNQVSDAVSELPYQVIGKEGDQMTRDHLVGMSNIVLYIYKRKIYERWTSVNDFISTLKALQVLLPIPKWLNDKGTFKSWQFETNNIEDCIQWHKKLQKEGITHLQDKSGNQIPVLDVYNEWYKNNKSYL